jgi:hypothetical protein
VKLDDRVARTMSHTSARFAAAPEPRPLTGATISFSAPCTSLISGCQCPIAQRQDLCRPKMLDPPHRERPPDSQGLQRHPAVPGAAPRRALGRPHLVCPVD